MSNFSCIPFAHNYSLINHTVIHVFGYLFIIAGIIASVGNTFALIILRQPDLRLKSNKVLTSLVVSDALMGYVFFPFTAYTLLRTTTSNTCLLEGSRSGLGVTLVIVSAFSVSFIAYDRNILLTKSLVYDNYISNKNVNKFILISWLLPLLSTMFDSVLYIKTNRNAANILMIAGSIVYIVTPLMIMVICYVLIVNFIRKQEKQMCKYRMKTPRGIQEMQTAILKKEQHCKQVKLSKKVTILIACYICCLLPYSLYKIIDHINQEVTGELLSNTAMKQGVLLFTELAGASNSCINPFIYAAKYPEFKRCFQRMFGTKKNKKNDRNMDLSSTVEVTIT